MDWGPVGIFVAVIFGITTIVLAIRLARRKKPVWAYKTMKIIGLGTDAPPELKLTFDGKPVSDVYRTVFILFNQGTEVIRNNDMTENVTIHFERAAILRQPTIKAISKEAIRFSAKQVVKGGDSLIELDFLYLDHNDGAVVEVLHTKSEEIKCSANIIGAKEVINIGEFVSFRTERISYLVVIGIMMLFVPFLYFSWELLPLSENVDSSPGEPTFIVFVIVATLITWLIFYVWAIRPFFRYRIFPKWSRFRE